VESISTHYLYPATLFASKNPHEVSTVLGSCVAVCLWDTHRKMGGINHYMLPLWNGEGLSTPKYGNVATQKLIEKMLSLGSDPQHLVAKVFGGAQQLEKGKSIFNIGERNVSLALYMLKEANIPIVSINTQGDRGRKLKFSTHTGEVLMKFV
jgi:chemotaxis protein CheD